MAANKISAELGWPLLLMCIIICAIAGHMTLAHGDWIEEEKLVPSDGTDDDWFGYSASICGDSAVIGVWWDDDNGDNSGSAYVYRDDGTGWGDEVKLLAFDGEAGDQFGESVSISGNTAVIGAPRTTTRAITPAPRTCSATTARLGWRTRSFCLPTAKWATPSARPYRSPVTPP